MGWMFMNGKGDRADLAREFHIDEPLREGGSGYTYTDLTIGRGKAWWVVRKDGAPFCIAMAMIQHSRKDAWGNPGAPSWGYKDMDETAGPSDADCPRRLIAMVADPHEGYSTEWRARVAAYWTAQAAKPSVRGLKAGDRIKIVDHLKPSYLSGSWQTVRAVDGSKISIGGYRVTKRYIAEVERVEAVAS